VLHIKFIATDGSARQNHQLLIAANIGCETFTKPQKLTSLAFAVVFPKTTARNIVKNG
jgi:hypothetical protein